MIQVVFFICPALSSVENKCLKEIVDKHLTNKLIPGKQNNFIVIGTCRRRIKE